MSTIFKKLFVTLAVIFAVTTAINFTTPTPVLAAGDDLGSCRNVFGLTSWDCGIANPIDSQDDLVNSIIIIAANIFTDIGVLATYLIIIYVIYGGYLYMFSSGDPGKVAAAKKTLTHAFIGLAIVMLTSVILNTIRIALVGAGGSFTGDCITMGNCVDQTTFIDNTLSWFIGIAGVVALLFIFIGGAGYLTSAGDAGKLQKAKHTILYAVIGLIIVALTFAIKAFVISLIARGDGTTSYLEPSSSLIAKESYES